VKSSEESQQMDVVSVVMNLASGCLVTDGGDSLCSSETSVATCKATRPHDAHDRNFNSHSCENLEYRLRVSHFSDEN
jgi:hypothetical protein